MNGHELAKYVIVVPAKVDNLGLFVFNFLQNHANEARTVLIPGAFAAFETPGVDNVAI
jgi:hypothetical protein